MTEAERILRGNITEIKEWDNEPFKGIDSLIEHAIIPYKDALKAVEEAIKTNKVDWGKMFSNCKIFEEKEIIKKSPIKIRLNDDDIEKNDCKVLRFKCVGGGKLDDWWVNDCVCIYNDIFIHFKLDESSKGNLDFKPYLINEEIAMEIIKQWEIDLG
tara:strand:+ start:6160 stop:6630 length:471 start_codon:yes stop_codon:yes gene_type:complete